MKPIVPQIATSQEAGESPNFLREFVAGLKFSVQNRVILALLVTVSVVMLGGSALNTLDIFFVRTSMGRHTIVATKAAAQVLSHLVKIAYYGAPLLLSAPATAGRLGWLFLMSLPLNVRWEYDYHPEPGSPEALLYDVYLKPHDWANE